MSEKPNVISTGDLETLSKIVHSARLKCTELMEEFENRDSEIETLENEIIQNYSNAPGIQLPEVPDHVQCQVVMANAQRMLSRITEIYNVCLKNTARMNGARQIILDA